MAKVLSREIVEEGLNQLINAAQKIIPSLREIRVFGSYDNGTWNPERSDVDVYIEIGDENYSIFKDLKQYGPLSFCPDEESERRNNLKARIKQSVTNYSVNRINITLLTPNDMNRFWDANWGRGPFGRNVKKGRLLYSSNGVGSIRINIGDTMPTLF